MAVWVLILYGAYFGVAFALQSFIHMRRTGSSAVKKLRAERFSAAWNAALILSLAALFGIAAPLLELLGLTRPLPGLNTWTGHLLGFALFAGALGLMFWSQLTMGRS